MTLNAHLIKLEADGLLRLAQVKPEIAYLFRHALIHDAAYLSLLKADRAEAEQHFRVALALGGTEVELVRKRLQEI